MDTYDWKKELIELLSKEDLSRDEILSVMIALPKYEKAEKMIAFLKEGRKLSADDIYQKAGEIAYGKNS